MVNLGQRCKETVSAAVLEFGQIRYIVRHESDQILRVSIQEGTRFPAHCCATGKVLLSALTDEDIKRLFASERGIKKCTPHSIDSLQGIMETLHKVRKEETAFDFEEALIGVHCMAAPIFNSKGDTVAAISISGPRDRVTRKKMREYQPLLVEIRLGVACSSAGPSAAKPAAPSSSATPSAAARRHGDLDIHRLSFGGG